jgi:hypothetical protein
MDFVEVDGVDPEAPQTRLAGRTYAFRRQALAAGIGNGKPHLRRDHDIVAATRQPRLERALGGAVAVHIRGVEEVVARVHERVEHRVRLSHPRSAPHRHRAEAEAALRQIVQAANACTHRVSFVPESGFKTSAETDYRQPCQPLGCACDRAARATAAPRRAADQ